MAKPRPFHVVIFSGARDWTNVASVDRVINTLQRQHGRTLALMAGGAKGLDSIVERLAANRGIPFARVDAQWNAYHKAAGPIRNHWMLRLAQPVAVHAFHPNIKLSKGTKDMVKQCKIYGIFVRVHRK